MEESIIVCSSGSPNGNVEAFVDQDDRVAYFYIRSDDEAFPLRSCWVRNLGPSGDVLDIEGMRAGLPPMLPRGFCRHPEGELPFDPATLRIVWLEEGDGAALIENDRLIAIIPCWSGTAGFSGYAAGCILESPLASPLTPDNDLVPRVQKSQEFWADWAEGAPDPWPQIQKHLLDAYAEELGPDPKVYAIDGGAWPPQALLRYPGDPGWVLLTAGVSIRPQPAVELIHEDPSDHRRIELGMALSDEVHEEEVQSLARYLGSQARFPWTFYTWLGPGHTLPCDALPIWAEGFNAVILTRNPPGAPRFDLGSHRENPVHLLWMIPITENERQLAMTQGGDALLERLWDAGVTAVFRRRDPVA